MRTGCLSVQRYNFLKANHNYSNNANWHYFVVYQFKDTIFWKQITTMGRPYKYTPELFISSKIQFSESKSQLNVESNLQPVSCLSVQRYNFLKANHNFLVVVFHNFNVVYQFKDTIFWKQITTAFLNASFCSSCLSVQRYNFLKANHNLVVVVCQSCNVVYQFKDTIFWKQITT